MEDNQNLKRKFLKKWTGDNSLQDFDIRSIIDWEYYKDRLAGTI
jgi:DNA polymerase epsilon subunit 1